MTFDEDLRRAFDALRDRLHAEIQQQVDAALAELRSTPPTPVEPAPAEPVPEPPVVAGPNFEAIVAALRGMDEARSLTDILDVLAAAAAEHGRGVAIRLRQNGRLEPWRGSGVDQAPEAPDAVRMPLRVAGEAIGELSAEEGAADALEILARHASRCLESMTAFRTARALARQPDPPTEADANEEDVSARRYARLLVSEIKLYHEAEVVAGRRDRDLTARLGGEIARARVLYDQRVPPHVRQRADHFHDELVRTLADGDSTLLESHA